MPIPEGVAGQPWAEAVTPPLSWARVTQDSTCSFPLAPLWAGRWAGPPTQPAWGLLAWGRGWGM